jgi:hypothetical protein
MSVCACANEFNQYHKHWGFGGKLVIGSGRNKRLVALRFFCESKTHLVLAQSRLAVRNEHLLHTAVNLRARLHSQPRPFVCSESTVLCTCQQRHAEHMHHFPDSQRVHWSYYWHCLSVSLGHCNVHLDKTVYTQGIRSKAAQGSLHLCCAAQYYSCSYCLPESLMRNAQDRCL